MGVMVLPRQVERRQALGSPRIGFGAVSQQKIDHQGIAEIDRRCVQQRSHSVLVDAVHVGDYLAMSIGLGLSGEGLRYSFDGACLERLGITSDDLDELSLDFITSYNQHEKLFEEAVTA